MALATGHIIDGKYRIVRVLGQGGMGAVYEGDNVRIHRRVAIKVLHAHVASKDDVVMRFEREAQAAGRIGSEHIVEVLDLGQLATGERYMVMEYLEGESLGARLKARGRLAPAELAPITQQLLEGLCAAHAAGIIHRDLKPDNVFLVPTRGGRRDFVKILDFGVSKFSTLDDEMAATRAGAVMGTPYYMSPEQARGAAVDVRCDVYAVGVMLYKCVTGRLPFQAETFNELIFKIALESPEPPEHLVTDLDRGFAEIIHKSMARDADARYQTAQEFLDAIAGWLLTSSSSGLHVAPFVVQPAPGQSGPLSQSGGPLGQSGGPLGQSGGPLGQSGGPLGQSGGPLGQSGGPLGQSGGPLGQSGGASSELARLSQSGSPLSQSYTASGNPLAITQQPTRKRSSVVVVVLAACAIVGGVAIYMFTRPPDLPSSVATAVPTPAVPSVEPSVEPLVEPAAATTSQLDEPAPSASASASAAPTAEPVAVKPRVVRRPTVVTPPPTTKPTTPKPTTPSGGRPISGDL